MKALVLIGFTSLFLVCTSTNAVFADLVPNLVGAWLFDEGEGKVVSDSSENGNDGEIVGEDVKWVDGKFGGALSLSGAEGNYVAIPDSPTLNPMEGITMMMWVKPDTTDVSIPLDKGPSGTGAYGMGMSSEFWLIIQLGASNILLFSETVITTGEWQHIAGTWDSKTRKAVIYRNGVDASDAPVDEGGDLIDDEAPLLIGCYDASDHWFAGEMDEVAIFDTALDADEIAKIYREGLQQAVFAVSASGKLAVTWGDVKSKY